MPLETLLKLLSAAKFPVAVTVFGLALNIGGGNNIARGLGASAVYLGFGSAATVVTRKSGQLAEIRQLEARHARETASLKASVQTAIEDTATAQQLAQSRENALNQVRGELTQLGKTITELRTERDRVKAEVLEMSAGANRMGAALTACDADKSQLAGMLHDLELERTQLIAELYETAVEEVAIAENIAALEKQFENDRAYQVTQKKKIKSEWTKARADMHTQLAEANDRIDELEAALKEKTELAQSMIADLSGDANSKFTQFSGQAGAQNELINGLRAQIEELRKSNKALTFRRFDTVGTDNIMSNRLIDALAKHGSTYGAFHHEREGHNGRLKVWLNMIDAPLKRAQDALDDIEAELSLWAKPKVKVDRGMHLFTLATEKEYQKAEVLEANLDRLEVTLERANHIRLVGPTDSGKSTFLDNLIWMGRLLWPTAIFDLLDPKAPFTEWSGDLEPDAKNLDCVEAIEGISQKLLARFNAANKIAEQYGNDSDEFRTHIEKLPYHLFVLDEAQYLYRAAKSEDKKTRPQGILANMVRDSLLDCLGVGRALKVKGYFITQSAKCSKLGMNEDDFDNATSVFLGSAILNALNGELKGSYSDAKLAKVTSEYQKRKAQNQQYLALVSDVDRDDLYLVECPNVGFYHARYLTAQERKSAIRAQADFVGTHSVEGRTGAAERTENGQESACVSALKSAPSSDSAEPPILKAVCPGCAQTSARIKGTKANSLGKYRFHCDNSKCTKQTFSAKPQ